MEVTLVLLVVVEYPPCFIPNQRCFPRGRIMIPFRACRRDISLSSLLFKGLGIEVISIHGRSGGITLMISLTDPHMSSVPFRPVLDEANDQWDKCFDGYWAFKEDLKHHKQEWRHVKEDWKHATQTWKQRLRSSRDITRAFHRMRG
jgi:tRNA nucleotidyltransferase/poly(A) polymerase